MNLKFDISKHSHASTIQNLLIHELFNIRQELIKEGHNGENQKIKLILTTSFFSSYVGIPNFFGGTDTVYVSDLVFTISDNIKILKNRFDETKFIQL